MKFILSSTPLEQLNLRQDLVTHSAGALNCFEGIVRNHNQGRQVNALEYDAYPDLCEVEMQKIFRETKNKFNIVDAACSHRIGRLTVGEMAVWIGVTSNHRDEAFKACRYLIDELKDRLPIWKKEYYLDENSEWINTQKLADEQTFNPQEYYSRQILLDQIGPHGQEKLSHAKVLVVGAGGLGCAALMGLASSGIGTIGICEFDLLQESNLHRQHLYNHRDIGKAKVHLATERIKSLNPSVQVIQFPYELTPSNIHSVIDNFDIVLDCTDNFKAKFLINDACVLYKKYLIAASLYQTDGQLNTYHPGKNSCLRCLWPEIPEQTCVETCKEAGVLGDLAAIFGHMQSLEVIKILLNLSPQIGTTLIYNALNQNIQKIKFQINPDCPVCGLSPWIKSIDDNNYNSQKEFKINVHQLSTDDIRKYSWIDVREDMERLMSPLTEIENEHWPFSEFSEDWHHSLPSEKYLFFCASGLRSQHVVEKLRLRGLNNVYTLTNSFDQIKMHLVNQLLNQNGSK
ncbi:MAG: ThiF family adenylyltransferase [Candidatus Omnitrophica bacterium]|nr:ThiF family adenylyltransferase [Candidatus Omnitrophota bacterium]